MKLTHILLLILIAFCAAAIVSTVGKSTSYALFAEANANPGKDYHIIGKLVKDKEMYYEPAKDPNFFTFYMTDSVGSVHKVIYHDTKPQDMEISEKLVVVGKMNTNHEFEAKEILKKCPSKYSENKIAEK